VKCVKRAAKKGTRARASFRRRNVRGGYLLFACPRWRWHFKRCVGGMKLYERVRTKIKGSCPRGWRRMRG
jgi:hypothetical protein